MGDFPFQPIYYNRWLLQIGWNLPEISFSVGWGKFVLLICRNVCFPKLQRRRARPRGIGRKNSYPPRPFFTEHRRQDPVRPHQGPEHPLYRGICDCARHRSQANVLVGDEGRAILDALNAPDIATPMSSPPAGSGPTPLRHHRRLHGEGVRCPEYLRWDVFL